MLLREQMEKMINEMLDGRILLDEALSEFEKLYIQSALARHSDHVSKTAAVLGIHRNTLAKRIAAYQPPKGKRGSKKEPGDKLSPLLVLSHPRSLSRSQCVFYSWCARYP